MKRKLINYQQPQESQCVINEFDDLLRLVDMDTQEKDGQEFEFVINDQYFDKLRTDFRNTCPVLFDLFGTLFPVDSSPDAKRKELCLVNSLCLLLKNDANYCSPSYLFHL